MKPLLGAGDAAVRIEGLMRACREKMDVGALADLGKMARSSDLRERYWLARALAFSRHPGAGYWAESRKIRGTRDQQKLRSVIEALAQRDGVCEAAARAHVARKVAVVQLVPYHSAKLKRRDVFGNLPSVCQARAFVHGLVREQSKLVIAARSVHEWGFAEPQNNQHLVVYRRALGASASLTLRSEGGRALLARLSPVMA